jgi:uncharacterized protein
MSIREDGVVIGVAGGEIVGTVIAPATRLPGVLFVHGWGGSRQQYLARAREVAALGCVCMTFDLSGHANTHAAFSTVSRETNLHDVVAAYDTLAALPTVDAARIAIVGSSYGGYLGAIVSTMRPVQWLVLRAPALYRDSGWALPKLQLHREQDLVTYRQKLVPVSENRALRACAKFEGDVLIIESESDTVVPPAVITSYREACLRSRSLSYRVIHQADHGLSDDAAQHGYTKLLVAWFKDCALGFAKVPQTFAEAPDPAVAIPETPPVKI